MSPPQINDAPGLKWRRIAAGWQAMWRARADLVKRGYAFKGMRLWESSPGEPEPNEISKLFISQRCIEFQDDMLLWARGGAEISAYDATWGGLVRAYRTDTDSPYLKKRYATRQHYDKLCSKIIKDCGADKIEDTDARKLLRLHEGWIKPDDGKTQIKISMGHALIGMMRTITTFGATLLKCQACRTIRSDLRDMRIKAGKPREEALTAEQATAIRNHAHTMVEPYRHSVALAQAFQFDCTLRQKDVIGEWVPLDEPGPLSDVISGNEKWIRGLRAEEIDGNFILRHITSKREKMLTLDLKLCPMVMEEFRKMAGLGPLAALERGHIPTSGPLIINEQTGSPWSPHTFRFAWRTIARACGVPDDVRSMDSRAGAITEALAAGAPMDAVRKGATHSNASMTQRYSRGDAEAVVEVLQHRAAHRNKSGNK